MSVGGLPRRIEGRGNGSARAIGARQVPLGAIADFGGLGRKAWFRLRGKGKRTSKVMRARLRFVTTFLLIELRYGKDMDPSWLRTDDPTVSQVCASDRRWLYLIRTAYLSIPRTRG